MFVKNYHPFQTEGVKEIYNIQFVLMGAQHASLHRNYICSSIASTRKLVPTKTEAESLNVSPEITQW